MLRSNLSQHHISHLELIGLLQNHTFASANDERKHAAALDGECHAHSVGNQAHGLLYDLLIGHIAIVCLHRCAASASGRQSKCQTGMYVASAFSVSCKPSAMRASQRLPDMLGTTAA